MTENLLLVILSTLLAGIAMPLGALVSSFSAISSKNELRHTVMAFGGGALLSAIALVLVPEGIVGFQPLTAAALLVLGGLLFMALDIWLARSNTPASQLAAMLADFIPESLALGAAFATGSESAFLLAILIGLQNLPEGFNAYLELKGDGVFRGSRIILIFMAMSLLGPIAGTVGYIYLTDYPQWVSGVMLVASGGILYSVFQDIAPKVRLETHWLPPMGAVLGFMLGLVGSMWAA
ncbi:divalent cation transporter [uncultured Umboniibacter sp.]|uniref:ZIP family metal transporter n=1 Tax=uncultured Umboniibacter sp. TaxID=1798917 RepID=UPI0026175A01|nr:divalent cation transporter [uncultured Umboniibacter sp.]